MINEIINMRREVLSMITDRASAFSSVEKQATELWRVGNDRSWIAAGLLCRISDLTVEDDAAPVEFLVRRIRDELATDPVVEQELLIEVLSSLVLQLPDQAWSKPVSLWSALVHLVSDEFGVSSGQQQKETSASRDQSDLAALVVRALENGWTDAVLSDVDSLAARKDYEWVNVLRSVARLYGAVDAMILLENDHDRDAQDVAQHLSSLKGIDRRRFVRLIDRRSGEEFVAEPVVDEDTGAVSWTFVIGIDGARELELLVGEESIADANVEIGDNRALMFDPRSGVLVKALGSEARTLQYARAASDKPIRGSADSWTIGLSNSEDGLRVSIRWLR